MGDVMKVREAIERIRRYGGTSIYTNNGTEIVLLDLCNSEWDCIGKIKVIGGKKIYRDIFCQVKPSKLTRHMEVIEKYTMYFPDGNGYSYFDNDEYVIPERDMNLFVSLNGGIDEYQTVSVSAYMYDDMMWAFCDKYEVE